MEPDEPKDMTHPDLDDLSLAPTLLVICAFLIGVGIGAWVF